VDIAVLDIVLWLIGALGLWGMIGSLRRMSRPRVPEARWREEAPYTPPMIVDLDTDSYDMMATKLDAMGWRR
jgi:hypothetical protein